jgi:hypothetical protein
LKFKLHQPNHCETCELANVGIKSCVAKIAKCANLCMNIHMWKLTYRWEKWSIQIDGGNQGLHMINKPNHLCAKNTLDCKNEMGGPY